MQERIDYWRRFLPLDQRWVIAFEEATGPTAFCSWVPGTWSAQIHLACGAPDPDRVIVHELWELAFYGLSEEFDNLAQDLPAYELLRRAHSITQNRLIESLVELTLGQAVARPLRIPRPALPQSLSVVPPRSESADPSPGPQRDGRAPWRGEKCQ